LSSDLGQKVNPVNTEGWKQYLDIMRNAGISNADLDAMAKKNPAELLGLK
jgi:predicted metal-dependent phosphotriesterase family hydrolase